MMNFMEYKLMGSVKTIKMDPNCLPSRFDCQKDRKFMSAPKPRPASIKRRKLETRKELLNPPQNSQISNVSDKLIQKTVEDTQQQSEDFQLSKFKEFNNKKADKSETNINETSTLPLVKLEFMEENESETVLKEPIIRTDPQEPHTWQKVVCTEFMEENKPETVLKEPIVRRTDPQEPHTWQKELLVCTDNVDQVSGDELSATGQPLLTLTEEVKPEHTDYVCSECGCYITGVRYKCVQCSDYDVCAACEARGVHALHYALRVPEHSVQDEVLRIIEAIRNCLNEDPSTIMMPEVKEEVKEELVTKEDDLSYVEECDPLTTLPDCEEQRVPRASKRRVNEINDDTLYVHTEQQTHIGPKQLTAPAQHSAPRKHGAPSHDTATIQHIAFRHTAPIQDTAPTHHKNTAASYNAPIPSKQECSASEHTYTASSSYIHGVTKSFTSQYDGYSTQTRSLTLTEDRTSQKRPCESTKRRKNTNEQENPIAEFNLPDQRLLMQGGG